MGYSSCLHKPCILSLACLAFSPIDCDHCEIIEEFYGESIGAEERDSLHLGPIPSLRHLRCVVVRFVRRLLRYYGSVRLPMIVHHRRSSLDFPMRSAFADNHGISQFPSKMFPCMPGVLDLAGSSCNIGIRCSRCCLPRSITPSAPRSFETISRLNTLPARTSINVPPTSLRIPAYDPRPAWFARPSL